MNSFRQMMNVMAPMSDGVELSCDIRMPRTEGPFPVVLVRNPYNKAIAVTDPDLQAYLAAGFAHVVQDARGKHESQGEYAPFLQEADDGRDTVDWVADQPWCNGVVVMTGASYTGWTQLAAAKTAPPALRAITPSVMGADPYRDLAYPGGVPLLMMLWWSISNNGRSQREQLGENWGELFATLPLRSLDAAVGCPSPAMQQWLDHPTRDKLWTDASVEPHYEQMQAATLLIGGWYDPFVSGTIRAQAGLAAAGKDARMVIGPWSHDVQCGRILGDLDFGAHSVSDVGRLKREFLIGCANGSAPDGPAVRVFAMGVNEWREFDHWPPAAATETPLYLGSTRSANSLHGDGTLFPNGANGADGADADRYTYNPADPVPAIGGAALVTNEPGPCDQRPAERRDDVLCYTTDVLTEPMEVMGWVALDLHASSSAPDTDFIGRLCDVYPDGRSLVICDGVLRARFREGFDKETMLTPGEPTRLRIDMGATACVFGKGHRIRLEVTSSCFPRFARNLNTGGVTADEDTPVVAQQTVHHSAQYPSRLLLPVVP